MTEPSVLSRASHLIRSGDEDLAARPWLRTRAARSEVLFRLAGELTPEAVIAELAIGGGELAAQLAVELALPRWSAPVAPLAPPWNSTPIYGAVAFDGSVHLDEPLFADLGLSRRELERAVARAGERLASAMEEPAAIELSRRRAAVIAEQSAAPITVAATIAALRNAGAERVVAVVGVAARRHLQRLGVAADHVMFA